MALFTAKYPVNIDAIKAGDNYFFVVPGQLDPVKVPAAAFEAMMEIPGPQTAGTSTSTGGAASGTHTVTTPVLGTTTSPNQQG